MFEAVVYKTIYRQMVLYTSDFLSKLVRRYIKWYANVIDIADVAMATESALFRFELLLWIISAFLFKQQIEF